MSTRNKFGGGNQTNINGLAFEEKVSLSKALDNVPGIKVGKNGDVFYKKNIFGKILNKHGFYKWFHEEYGVDLAHNLSKKLLPDNVFYNLQQEKIYIIEVKYQKSEGSVDEKLQTFQFKKYQYMKMMRQLEQKTNKIIDVEYIYILNEYFKQAKYIDVLNYIRQNGSSYYFETIPINKIGIY